MNHVAPHRHYAALKIARFPQELLLRIHVYHLVPRNYEFEDVHLRLLSYLFQIICYVFCLFTPYYTINKVSFTLTLLIGKCAIHS